MSSLQLFDNDGIELVIDTNNGDVYYPGYRALARICSIGLEKPIHQESVKRTILSYLKGVTDSIINNTEILTRGGTQAVTLIARKLGSVAIKKYNPDLWDAMGEAGHVLYLHGLAGYDKKSSTNKESNTAKQDIPSLLGLIKNSLLNCGIDNALVEGVYLNGIAHHYPEVAQQVNEAHKLLAASTQSELLLTPTSIGKRLGISAIQVNLLLRKLGYQKQNIGAKKGEPAYLPTEEGKPFAGNTIATGKVGDDSSYQHLKWKESILDVLSSEIAQ